MSYRVKELYLTRQGEGVHTGRLAVFCRFSGCNLWSGREQDRADAQCRFCDTDFRGVDGPGGGVYEQADDLAAAVGDLWPSSGDRFIVCTGGEPLLQLDDQLITALHERGFQVAVETNGTIKAPDKLDWICVSPKAHNPLIQNWGDELKLVYPQAGLDPGDFCGLGFKFFSLQPLDDHRVGDHIRQTVDYCRRHPLWRLSLQTHKYCGWR